MRWPLLVLSASASSARSSISCDDQDQARTRLVVIELGEERGQNLGGRQRFVGPRKIGTVAPVLPGAEEEHLDAGEAALLMQGKDVRLLDAARIDPLVRLNRRERGQAVAVDGGMLEVERERGLFHLGGELILDRLAAAGEEGDGLAHQHRILREVDLVGARRRAALDLMQQARPGAALEERVAARAQQERALQRVDRAVDGPDRGERSEIVARPRARAAVLEDLRRPMIGRDQDIGKRFVVAQQHVEARPQPLDHVRFEQQRLGLGAGDDEFERARCRDHPLDASVEAGRTRIGAHPVLHVLRLADVEHVAARVDHPIDAGLRRRVLGIAEDGGPAVGERTALLLAALAGGLRHLRKGRFFILLGDVEFRLDVFLRRAHRFDLLKIPLPRR